MKRVVLLICLFGAVGAYEVLGVGTVCIDYLAQVDEAFLDELSVEKGQWKPVEWEEFKPLLERVREHAKPLVMTGGCTANTIKGLAALGTKCALASRVGRDEMGRFAQNTLLSRGISPLFAFTLTPMCQIICLVTPDGERSFCSYIEAEREFSPSDLEDGYFDGPRLVHMDGYLLRNANCLEQVVAMAKKKGCTVSFDVGNARLAKEAKGRLLEHILPKVDLLFANQEEAEALTGLLPEEAAEMLSKICQVAVVKVGEKGCFVGWQGEMRYSPGVKAHVVDTTGAGDLFAAGFLHRYLEGAGLQECAEFGNRMGSLVVEVVGAEIPENAWHDLVPYCSL